jgi:uncharacterized membrane protein
MTLDLSLLGWIHAVACAAALALGAVNLMAPKGTDSHRRIGNLYLCVMLFANLASLGIYRQHRFFFPHWLAIAAIALSALAFAFARFKRPRRAWLRGHIISVALTYYLLLGGGVNEAFLRIDFLRHMSGGFPSPLANMTQLALLMLTAVALVWFNRSSTQRVYAKPDRQ